MLQDLLEHDAHEPAEVFKRLPPPPIPNEEKSFCTPELRHSGQLTPPSAPRRTSSSKWQEHALQTNSYSGIGYYFTPICLESSTSRSGRSLLGEGDDFDFNFDVARQTGYLKGRPGRVGGLKKLSIDLVHQAEIVHVLKKNRGLYHLV